MVRRRKEDALATRLRVLDAAADVFWKRGAAQASLSEVAQAAGVTRGAVYWHFSNKAALFLALTGRAESIRRDRQRRLSNQAQHDPLGALRDGAIEALLTAAAGGAEARLYELAFLRTDLNDEFEAAHRLQQESEVRCSRSLEETLRAALARGQLPGTLDAELAAGAMYSYVTGLMRTALHPASKLDLASRAETLVERLLTGLKHCPPNWQCPALP